MKNLKVAALVAVCLIGFTSKAQFSFSVSPSLSLNTANFGYSINNKFMPYLGVQFYNASGKVETSGQEFDPFTGQFENFEDVSKISASMLIPTIGLKYYAFEKEGLRGYFNVNFSKPLVFGKAEYDGMEDEFFQEQLDALSFWGGEFGFGTEYNFSEAFSVGGEFGLRWVRANDEITTTSDYYDPNTGTVVVTEQTSDLSINFSPTYARFSFNFYFANRGE